jgi:hypothetical protein
MRPRVLAAASAAALVLAPVALTDGDPASDYLLSQKTFVPFDAKVPSEQAQALNGIVTDAKRKGYTVRVAIISRPFDLGAVPSLWRKPKTYARFLGQELFFVYKGRLLVVMPNGYGVSRGGKPLASGQHVVDALPKPGSGGAALAAAATRAVRKLATQEGVHAVVPASASGSSSSTNDRLIIAAAAGGIALLILAGMGLRRVLAAR